MNSLELKPYEIGFYIGKKDAVYDATHVPTIQNKNIDNVCPFNQGYIDGYNAYFGIFKQTNSIAKLKEVSHEPALEKQYRISSLNNRKI